MGTGRETGSNGRGGLPDIAGTPLYLAPELFDGGRASERDLPSAGADVQEPLAGPDPEPLDQSVVNRREPLGDELVLAVAPPDRRVAQSSSLASAVSRFRADQSSGYMFLWIRRPSTSTGVPCVPTTSSPMIRATVL